MAKVIEGTQGMVAGKKRQGKSYFVKKTLIPLLAKKKPVIILDRKHEYGGRNAVDFDKSWKVWDSGIQFIKHVVDEKRISDVNVVLCSTDKDYNTVIPFIKELERPVSLIIDEAHDIYLSRDFADAKNNAVRLSRYGATFGVDTIWISQRTKDVPTDIRYQFDWLISFRQGSKADTEAIDEMGFENGESVRDLKEREKVLFSYLPDFLKVGAGEFKTINR